jgi:hypothetical protein
MLMDAELCDAVMMGVVQLQAAFSVLAPRFAILGSRDGGTLSKGWIRCTTGVRRVLPSLRVVRVRHHKRLLWHNTTRRLSNLYNAL